jgi:hypothetical protein
VGAYLLPGGRLDADGDYDQLPPGEFFDDRVRVLRFAIVRRDGARFKLFNSRVMSGERLS